MKIIHQTREATLRYTRIYQQFAPETVDQEHRMIYEAAAAGHGRRLESLVAAHLADGYESMIAYLATNHDFTHHYQAHEGGGQP